MNNPLRWKQRFENFERALEVFQARAEECRENPRGSEYYEAFHMALIHSFEILIELSWKTLKDYLENEGYNDVQNGKRAIRRAFQDGIVQEGETWMEALEKRNLTVHTYQEEILEEVTEFLLGDFSPIVRDLHQRLKVSLLR